MLRDEILKEHSKAQTLKIIDFIGTDKQKFDALMQLFLYDEYRVSQRAAWPVSLIIEKHPELAKKYLPKMLDNLKNPVHDAVRRNTVRILYHIDIPEKLHAQVLDICFAFVQKRETSVAVKSFSIDILDKLSKQYPEIKNEIKILIDDQLPTATAAFKSRAKKIKL